MILDIDAGNTRLKARLTEPASKSSAGVSFDLTLDTAGDSFTQSLADHCGNLEIERVRIASVRNSQFNEALADSVKSALDVEGEFAAVAGSACGVSNGYNDITTMGVDRWLAMLEAYSRARSACCILDCGSAITFDWIDYEGQHQGGLIVPGIKLMQQSLAEKSSALDLELDEWGSADPGNSTSAAISHGILAAATGFARQCRELLEQRATQCQWYLTGGDAELISTQLGWEHEIAKDLVLDGLALALP